MVNGATLATLELVLCMWFSEGPTDILFSFFFFFFFYFFFPTDIEEEQQEREMWIR